ncbi:MAG: hypothetical protein LWX08_14035 [Deltaproteobacteria bacterium]|nr:hypothetical protein [Deltaproteobacteria bacterium]
MKFKQNIDARLPASSYHTTLSPIKRPPNKRSSWPIPEAMRSLFEFILLSHIKTL